MLSDIKAFVLHGLMILVLARKYCLDFSQLQTKTKGVVNYISASLIFRRFSSPPLKDKRRNGN